MFKRIILFIRRRKLVAILFLIILAAAGYKIYQNYTADSTEATYITSAAEKGTLITSVSGSGQVLATDQLDIKPEVSSKITAVSVKNSQEVKKGELLFSLDARDAQRSVSDAEISLESARVTLEDLQAGADAQDLLRAENAVSQAQRDLEKTQKNYDNIEADAEDVISTAYEDGYSNVSATFFDLSDYMNNLQVVMGTSGEPEKNIDSYKNILGENSQFIQKLVDDYDKAKDLYEENFDFFRTVYKNDDRDTVYQLINNTITTTEAIAQALESARHMFDEITAENYAGYSISSTIDTLQPKIESNLSAAFSSANSLRNTKQTIDDTVEAIPDNIKDAKLSLESAKENLAEKEQALADLKLGSDPLDIRAQQNTVAQKEAALTTSRENLADHFVRAPFDGVIEEMAVNVGDSASSGTILAILITKERIAEITLNEIDIAKVKVGQKANIMFDALENLSVTGEVAEVDALGTISQGVVSYDVTVIFDIQDERVKPGMSLSVDIVTEIRPSVVIVPNAAVKTQGNANYVEILDNGQARRQTVEVGLSNDTMTEIVSGLSEGDQVITQTVNATATGTSAPASGGTNSLIPTGRVPGAGGNFNR